MRCLYLWFSAALLACTPATGKVDIASDAESDASEEGANSEGSVGDGDSETDEEYDSLADRWEEVLGWSVLADGEVVDSDQDVWFFREELGGKSSSKDGHDDEERDPGPACLMSAGGWEPVCVAFTGEAWGTMPELDPEEQCRDFDEEEDADWSFTDAGCPVDAKAMCLMSEGTSYSMKVLYYNPMPLSEAEESCVEAEGSFYPLADDEGEDEGEDEEEEYELGVRWEGMIIMDNSFGVASFVHFNEEGRNCKADALMERIEDVEECTECLFSKRFQIGEFSYEIDEGGCPDDLDETEGAIVTFGHGADVIFEQEDFVLHSLWYLDDDEQ